MVMFPDTIATHPRFLDCLRLNAGHLRGEFDQNPRLARMMASQQRWLLSQAAFALQLQYDPAQPGSGLTTTALREIITTNNAASRNTVLNFLDQMESYKFVRIVGELGRRPKRYQATEITTQAMFRWLVTNLALLDALDGAGRAAEIQARPELFRFIQPLIAHWSCEDARWREPPERVGLFLWTEAGGLVVDDLIRRVTSLLPDGSGYELGRVDARSMAQQFMISRTHLQRLFRRAADMGCIQWIDDRRDRCVLLRSFVEEYCQWQAFKFSIIDRAYTEICGPARASQSLRHLNAVREA